MNKDYVDSVFFQEAWRVLKADRTIAISDFLSRQIIIPITKIASMLVKKLGGNYYRHRR